MQILNLKNKNTFEKKVVHGRMKRENNYYGADL